MKALVTAAATLALMTASSQATLTPVLDIHPAQPGGGDGEWNLYNSGAGNGNQGTGIMEYLYGGGFSRVDDSVDIQWVGTGSASMQAVYAGYSQSLYSTDLSGGSQANIAINTTATAGAPTRTAPNVGFSPTPQPFLFLDNANGGANPAYSDPTKNGGTDRMVTFLITGYMSNPLDPGNNQFVPFTDGLTHYVIAFEDLTDNDYNDLVVEVKGVAPVPEPTTMIAGALLLLPFGASTLRILRRRTA